MGVVGGGVVRSTLLWRNTGARAKNGEMLGPNQMQVRSNVIRTPGASALTAKDRPPPPPPSEHI